MSVSRLNDRIVEPAERLFAWAFGISLAAHVLIYGGFHLGDHLGWWKKDLLPSWLKSTKLTLAELQKAQQNKPPPPQQQQPPLLFVEVDPSVATQEAPKNATHYSSRNSYAGNPDIKIDSAIPNIDGRQTHVVKTQDADLSRKAMPLRPSAPKEPPPTPAEGEKEAKAKPKGGPQVGDLAMAKPAPQPGDGQAEKDTGEAKVPEHKRPHTLLEALQQQQRSTAIPGQKMRQEGGVRRHLDASAFDTIATPFGEYDRELIDAITTHWWGLLDRKEFSQDRTGKVVIVFTLRSDGRVTDVHVVHSEVGDLLSSVCELAITDPAPYAPWPGDMRRYYAKDSIDLTFTFWYDSD